MTQQGVEELYMWLTTAWPLVIKPGVEPEWKKSKMRELYRTYKEYDNAEVFAAFQKWTAEHDKFPTTHSIVNELQWARKRAAVQGHENEELWPMDYIKKDGTEWSFGMFRRAEFVENKHNPERLQPEEWERRLKLTRSRILNRIQEENIRNRRART